MIGFLCMEIEQLFFNVCLKVVKKYKNKKLSKKPKEFAKTLDTKKQFVYNTRPRTLGTT